MTVATAARDLGNRLRVDVTTHEFTSAFEDWRPETTWFSNAVHEAALPHVIQSKAEGLGMRTSCPPTASSWFRRLVMFSGVI
jgi:hypothetical protein